MAGWSFNLAQYVTLAMLASAHVWMVDSPQFAMAMAAPIADMYRGGTPAAAADLPAVGVSVQQNGAYFAFLRTRAKPGISGRSRTNPRPRVRVHP